MVRYVPDDVYVGYLTEEASGARPVSIGEMAGLAEEAELAGVSLRPAFKKLRSAVKRVAKRIGKRIKGRAKTAISAARSAAQEPESEEPQSVEPVVTASASPVDFIKRNPLLLVAGGAVLFFMLTKRKR